MNFTVISVENVIREWCQTIGEAPFYFLDESVTRPAGLYGMLRLMAHQTVGTPSENFTDETVDGDPWSLHDVNEDRLITCSVNTYRLGARDVLSNILAGYRLVLPLEILSNANIGIIRFSDIRDLSEVIEGRFEERAQMDITFNVIGSSSELLNTIDQAPIDSSFQ